MHQCRALIFPFPTSTKTKPIRRPFSVTTTHGPHRELGSTCPIYIHQGSISRLLPSLTSLIGQFCLRFHVIPVQPYGVPNSAIWGPSSVLCVNPQQPSPSNSTGGSGFGISLHGKTSNDTDRHYPRSARAAWELPDHLRGDGRPSGHPRDSLRLVPRRCRPLYADARHELPLRCGGAG
jgi:hypothetical protein